MNDHELEIKGEFIAARRAGVLRGAEFNIDNNSTVLAFKARIESERRAQETIPEQLPAQVINLSERRLARTAVENDDRGDRIDAANSALDSVWEQEVA